MSAPARLDALDALDALLTPLAEASRLLVASDFDGTLAPRVDAPMAARMIPAARPVLTALAALPGTSVALVSGRSLPDLRVIAEHDDDSPFLLAGSHGAEYWTPGHGVDGAPDAAELALRERLRAAAEPIVAAVDGAFVEPKTFGFGVHTRLADAGAVPALYRATDALVAREAPTWRRRTGHDLVEYSFRDAGKDAAIARLRAATAADAVLFAGDDVTDEDALATLAEADLGIRVGEGETHARLRVADPAELVAVLDRLAMLRGQAARGAA